MRRRKNNTLAVSLIVILSIIIATAVGALAYFSDGYTNWDASTWTSSVRKSAKINKTSSDYVDEIDYLDCQTGYVFGIFNAGGSTRRNFDYDCQVEQLAPTYVNGRLVYNGKLTVTWKWSDIKSGYVNVYYDMSKSDSADLTLTYDGTSETGSFSKTYSLDGPSFIPVGIDDGYVSYDVVSNGLGSLGYYNIHFGLLAECTVPESVEKEGYRFIGAYNSQTNELVTDTTTFNMVYSSVGELNLHYLEGEHLLSLYDDNEILTYLCYDNRETVLVENIPVPTKTGYIFDGWTYADGTKFDYTVISEDVSLYASWIEDETYVPDSLPENVVETYNIKEKAGLYDLVVYDVSGVNADAYTISIRKNGSSWVLTVTWDWDDLEENYNGTIDHVDVIYDADISMAVDLTVTRIDDSFSGSFEIVYDTYCESIKFLYINDRGAELGDTSNMTCIMHSFPIVIEVPTFEKDGYTFNGLYYDENLTRLVTDDYLYYDGSLYQQYTFYASYSLTPTVDEPSDETPETPGDEPTDETPETPGDEPTDEPSEDIITEPSKNAFTTWLAENPLIVAISSTGIVLLIGFVVLAFAKRS